jgi:hypothetical protein
MLGGVWRHPTGSGSALLQPAPESVVLIHQSNLDRCYDRTDAFAASENYYRAL